MDDPFTAAVARSMASALSPRVGRFRVRVNRKYANTSSKIAQKTMTTMTHAFTFVVPEEEDVSSDEDGIGVGAGVVLSLFVLLLLLLLSLPLEESTEKPEQLKPAAFAHESPTSVPIQSAWIGDGAFSSFSFRQEHVL